MASTEHASAIEKRETTGEVRARTFRFAGNELLVLSFELAPRAGGATLTSAEREVAESILRGASNLEIASQRGRSVNTIANQVASAFRKLGVRSRLELARVLAACPLAPLNDVDEARA